MEKVELLAPAGSLEALKAAVENGADAVYIGGSQFSARQKAENFTEEKMAEGIQYAHDRNVKVFVALNTLVNNEEIGNLIPYIYQLAELKVDALIVQDLGVAQIVREVMPSLPLHASTQMVVHNTPGVQFLEGQGYERVVLARETSLEAIREIKANTNAELEVFVHGALCVSYSGQCLLSSMIGGRSGNRGFCAQPCRMQYQLLDEKGNTLNDLSEKHLLSTRDLNMIHHLPELIAAGVKSFKIEGRMKRPEYVATVVHHYREAIDAYYNKVSFDKKLADKELLQIFNRKFTTGYFYGNQGHDLMSYERPNNRGVEVAEILKTEKKKIWIQMKDELAIGDGYLLFNQKGDEVAGKVQNLSIKGNPILSANKGQIVQMTVKGNAAGATVLYRTADEALLHKAEDSYLRPSPLTKKPVHFKVELRKGEPISVLAWDDEGHQQYVSSEYLVEEAKNRPTDEALVRKQMDRLGNTRYSLGDLICEIEDGVIAPASELNQLRRDAIEGLDAQVLEETRPEEELCSLEDYLEDAGDLLDRIPPQVLSYGLKQRLAVTVGTEDGFKAAVDGGADLVYLNVTKFRRTDGIPKEMYAEYVEYAHGHGAEVYWTCSPIENDHQLKQVKLLMEAAKEAGFDGISVGNLGLLHLAKEMGWVNIVADYTMNLFNDVSLQYLSDLELSRAVLSPELTLEQIKDFAYLGNLPIEILIHGNFPLMVSEYCVCGSVLGGRTAKKACSQPCKKQQYYLQDRMGVAFPLYMDQNCRMHIMNSKTLSLYKRLEECLETGVDIFRIEAKEQSATWIRISTEIYKKAIEEYNETGHVTVSVQDLNRLEALAPEGSTYGHYFRGV